jgi:hypothetical protein
VAQVGPQPGAAGGHHAPVGAVQLWARRIRVMTGQTDRWTTTFLPFPPREHVSCPTRRRTRVNMHKSKNKYQQGSSKLQRQTCLVQIMKSSAGCRYSHALNANLLPVRSISDGLSFFNHKTGREVFRCPYKLLMTKFSKTRKIGLFGLLN